MAKKIKSIHADLRVSLTGKKLAVKEIKAINKNQRLHFKKLGELNKKNIKVKTNHFKKEDKHLSKLKKSHKKLFSTINKGNSKIEKSLHKQLFMHEKIYRSILKGVKASMRYGGSKLKRGIRTGAKGALFGSLGAVAGKLISRGVRQYQNVSGLVDEAPEVAGDYTESLSKAKTIFSEKVTKGTTDKDAIEKAKRNDAIYRAGFQKLMATREGRAGGTGLGRVELTSILADVGAQLKGFGYEGEELISQVDEYLKAAVDIASLYNLKSVTEAASMMTKVYTGETEQAKERLGIIVQEKIIMGKLKHDQEVIDKFIKIHGVSSFAELDERTKLKVKSEARSWVFRDIALRQVGAKGDYKRTFDSYGNLSKELKSIMLDYKNEIGQIVQEKSKKEMENTIKVYKAQIKIFRDAKTTEEKAKLYEKYGNPIEKLQKIKFDALRRDVSGLPISAQVTATIMTSIDTTANAISDSIGLAIPKILELVSTILPYIKGEKNLRKSFTLFISEKVDEITKAIGKISFWGGGEEKSK